MAIKFKLAETISDTTASELLRVLNRQGFPAQRLFPNQQRPKLKSVYVILGADEALQQVRHALDQFGDEVEFVEGAATRHPMAAGD